MPKLDLHLHLSLNLTTVFLCMNSSKHHQWFEAKVSPRDAWWGVSLRLSEILKASLRAWTGHKGHGGQVETVSAFYVQE